jgi:hypothetical protein
MLLTANDGSGGSDYDAIDFTGSDLLRVYFQGSISAYLVTNQVFRDPSAWYHLVVAVDTTQATSSNRVKIYINGSQITSLASSTYPSQNYDTYFNLSGRQNVINAASASTINAFFDGYTAEVNFIDGQQLTPSSFGSTNALTGVWQPAKYTGTYGTNGFYLPFTNTTSTTTLGYDFSGNSNNWTTNNLSLTAGTTYDSMTDVPTLTSATTANYCVWNPLRLDSTSTLSNGNLTVTKTSGGGYGLTTGTFAVPTSGKWYWEVTITAFDYGVAVGVTNTNDSTSTYIEDGTYSCGYYSTNGNIYYSTGNSAYGNTYAVGDIIGVAVDMDNGAIYFAKNNTYQNSGVPTSGASKTGAARTNLSGANIYPSIGGFTSQTHTLNINCGQRPFSYTPPTGFVALNTYNLPTSTIVKGNTVMDATLWNGTSATQSIVNTAPFQPDFVWIKSRSSANSHRLFDSVRGATKILISNATNAEATESDSLTAFNSNGFALGADTVGGGVNISGRTYVGWQWQAGGTAVSNTAGSVTSQVSANTTSGFSVVKFTSGASAGFSVGHGLGVAPAMIIQKITGDTGGWLVAHQNMSASGITSGYLQLQSTNGFTSNSNVFTSVTSSTVTQGSVVSNNFAQIMYCWAEIAGFSKFGSYTGNGSSDGPFIYTGFRPRYVMVKRTDSTADWIVFDTARSPYNFVQNILYPNLSDAENVTGSAFYDILSNGFKARLAGGGAVNTSGGTYIYMAFAENPFKNALAR